MTKSTDIVFKPKVWNDHIQAHFDTKLGIGSLALVDKTLVAEPGETKNFPFWKKMGPAKETGEDEGVEIDKLTDDSFSVTVKEVTKGVGWKDKAHIVSAAGKSDAESEAQRQLGILYAEKIELDLIDVMNTSFKAATVATTDAKMTIRDLLMSKIIAFGDKQNEAKALVIHSLDFANMMSESTAGFLHADATMPMFGMPGFQGKLLGMDVFVLDSVPPVEGGIASKKAWHHFFLKEAPFGVYMKQDLNIERDRDIVMRENVVTSTMWYGVLSLHAKVAATDIRVARGAFSSGIAL